MNAAMMELKRLEATRRAEAAARIAQEKAAREHATRTEDIRAAVEKAAADDVEVERVRALHQHRLGPAG